MPMTSRSCATGTASAITCRCSRRTRSCSLSASSMQTSARAPGIPRSISSARSAEASCRAPPSNRRPPRGRRAEAGAESFLDGERKMDTKRDVSKVSRWRNPRWRWLSIAAAAFLAAGAGYTAYWLADARWHVATDDAYVDGNVVEITPQISGTVVAIGADDTQLVRAGQPLVRLDPADAQVALDEADAKLARTVREVRNQFSTTAGLKASVEVRASQLSMAQKDLARRERLGSSGAISNEELQHARDAVRSNEAALLAAKEQLAANRARIDGTTLASHPDVRDAAAAVRNAYLELSRTMLPAPVRGLVAKRNVQLGERVSPGMALMSVVPLDQVWVDANFKE